MPELDHDPQAVDSRPLPASAAGRTRDLSHLCLTLRPGDRVFAGELIVLACEVRADRVKLRITARRGVPILREAALQRILRARQAKAERALDGRPAPTAKPAA